MVDGAVRQCLDFDLQGRRYADFAGIFEMEVDVIYCSFDAF